MKKLTDTQVTELVEKYKTSDISACELGRRFCISHGAVAGLLKRRGIKLRNNRIYLTKEQLTKMKKLYISGKGTYEIARIFKISQAETHRKLKLLGVKFRSKEVSRKFNLRQDFFSCIDNEEKAYFLGFVYADGSNSGHVLSFQQARRDSEILHKLSMILFGKSRVKYGIAKSQFGKEYPTAGLTVCSNQMAKDLTLKGAPKNKTFKIKNPKKFIPKKLYRHFIRGFFDGDGGICNHKAKAEGTRKARNRTCVSFIGTYSIIKWIQEVLMENKVITQKKISKPNKMRTIQISGRDEILKIYKYFYSGTQLYLKRKKEKFEKGIRRFGHGK